jgi:putative transposase
MTEMRTGQYSEQQIIGFLNRANAGEPVPELCRKEGFSQPTFYKWRSRFGGMQASEAVCQRALEGDPSSTLGARKSLIRLERGSKAQTTNRAGRVRRAWVQAVEAR